MRCTKCGSETERRRKAVNAVCFRCKVRRHRNYSRGRSAQRNNKEAVDNCLTSRPI